MNLAKLLALPVAIAWIIIGLLIFGLLAVIDWITDPRWKWPTRMAKKI